MNVEKLHRIVVTVVEALAAEAVIPKARTVSAMLERSVSSPGEALYQQELSEARLEVEQTLERSSLNDLPALDQQILEEIGVAGLLGKRARDRVEAAFQRNEVTPAVALAEINELVNELDILELNLGYFVASADYFGIRSEELAPGQAELAIMVPRGEVHEETAQFGRELQKLDKIVAPFFEVVGETPEPTRLAAVSSSDYGVFLDLAPHVALAVAGAVSFILDQYKKVLDIRLLKSQLDGLQLPGGAVTETQAGVAQGLMKMATETMESAIAAEVASIDLSATVTEEGRQNEVRVALTVSYARIADRVDRGYNFDVRAGDDPEGDDGPTSSRQVLQSIRDLAPSLKFVNQTGDRILELEQAAETEPEDSDDTDARPPS